MRLRTKIKLRQILCRPRQRPFCLSFAATSSQTSTLCKPQAYHIYISSTMLTSAQLITRLVWLRVRRASLFKTRHFLHRQVVLESAESAARTRITAQSAADNLPPSPAGLCVHTPFFPFPPAYATWPVFSGAWLPSARQVDSFDAKGGLRAAGAASAHHGNQAEKKKAMRAVTKALLSRWGALFLACFYMCRCS